ncbi:serine O-acetyltransferase [Nakamurella alba]|uniref:serine O-acetyltransferase n=1 Tax=Nakamurella alba TaxID=2665158 RepID=UPI002AC3502C|nr:DapH/DapD/GlmU-related protein [Nakamurella alba]
MKQLIRSDIDRYQYMLELDGVLPRRGPQLVRDLRTLLLCKGAQAGIVFRLGHALIAWTPTTVAGRWGRRVGRIGHWMAGRVIETRTGIQIADRATIGPGLYIGHFGGVIIGVVTMGANCNLSHGVTLGRSGRVGDLARPTLGDRVWVGPGAVLVGGITIGDDAAVGANTVVTKDLPARSTSVGSPPRTFPDRGSFEMIVYRGSEEDPGRHASLLRIAPAGGDRGLPEQRRRFEPEPTEVGPVVSGRPA